MRSHVMAKTTVEKPGSRSASDFFPERITMKSLREAAANCRGCDLYKNATQTVFGEGSKRAECVLIGEQPGDQEDRQGKPFVGPAGRMLDKAVEEAGIESERVYITNAVKHFKHDVRGKRRLHRSPNRAEAAACRPWLEEELRIVRPKVLVCLGVSAAQTLLGRKVTLRDDRGHFFESEYSPRTFITTHPSAILRSIDSESRHAKYAEFLEDLRKIAKELGPKQ